MSKSKNETSAQPEQPKEEKVRGMVTKEFTASLKCDLKPEELLACGEAMAAAMKDLRQAESDLSSLQKQYKSKIEDATCTMQRAANLIRDRFEFRPVNCKRTLNFKDRVISEYRLDTAEMITNRPMTVEESQMGLEGVE